MAFMYPEDRTDAAVKRMIAQKQSEDAEFCRDIERREIAARAKIAAELIQAARTAMGTVLDGVDNTRLRHAQMLLAGIERATTRSQLQRVK